MFAIVFGLSMDYEVFLLTRIKEAFETAAATTPARVAAGLASTARVITCAALIMASVFISFVLSTNVVVKMLAVGLSASVLVDATIVRLVLVPATMYAVRRAPTGGYRRGWTEFCHGWRPSLARRSPAPVPTEEPVPTEPEPIPTEPEPIPTEPEAIPAVPPPSPAH